MKNLMGVMEGGSLPSLSNLQEAMKVEEKVHWVLFALMNTKCVFKTSEIKMCFYGLIFWQ